jgi:trehalose 2-sulfotransferase
VRIARLSQRSYLVCATPRSGSTLLCESLKATGVAGRPEEYFEALPRTGIPRGPEDYLAGLADGEAHRLVDGAQPQIPVYSDVRRVEPYEAHLARVREWGTTPNGVFGAKLMWAHLVDLAGRTCRPSPARAAADLFGEPRCLWVRREDPVRQAVSLWRAMQTQSWRAEADGAPREPRYSFAALRHLTRMLEEHDAAWERFFAESAIPVLPITYAELAGDLRGTVARALEHIGVPCAVDGTPPLRRQSDELSDAWVAAYERDRA